MWGAQGAAEGCAMDGGVTATYPFYLIPPLADPQGILPSQWEPWCPLGMGPSAGILIWFFPPLLCLLLFWFVFFFFFN